MKIKTKVLLKIYPKVNLGDDLFVKIIVQRYPNIDFYLYADDIYKNIFGDYRNLRIYNELKTKNLFERGKGFIKRKFFSSLYRKQIQKDILDLHSEYFNKCDVFVSIGGSIFMESIINGDVDYEIEYYKLITSYFDKKSIFFIGCNFGPYKTERYLREYEGIFKKSMDICFREKYSVGLFKELTNVRFAPDVVFGYDVKNEINSIQNGTVGFSIISARNGVNKKVYVEKFVELIEYYLKINKSIYLFGFCIDEGDREVIEEIYSKVDKTDNVHKIYYEGNINEFLNVYSRMEKMYCGRFHSMILSMLYKQEIFPIIYSDKMANVLRDINYSGESIRIEEFVKYNSKALAEKITNSDFYQIEDHCINAKKQFSKLDISLQNL